MSDNSASTHEPSESAPSSQDQTPPPVKAQDTCPATEPDNLPEHSFFSHHTYFSPFGRYESDQKAEFPDNHVMIGREGQRSYFTQRLLNTECKGAYLITGYRGTGKTSFVQYCLDEYKRDVYTRFLSRVRFLKNPR